MGCRERVVERVRELEWDLRELRNTEMLIDVWNNYISPTKIPVFKNTRNTGAAVMPATAFTVPVITSPIVYV